MTAPPHERPPYERPPYERPPYIDLDPAADRPERDYDVVELKHDGMWAEVTIHDHLITLDSRNGTATPPTSGSCRSLLDATIVGEFLRGTAWSRRSGVGGVRRHGRFVAFDLIRLGGVGGRDLRSEPLSVRRRLLEGLFAEHLVGGVPGWFDLSEQWPASEWERLWAEHVATGDFEGLVFKNSGDVWGGGEGWARMKREVTVDYVCMGCNLSKAEHYASGAAASIRGGLFVNGVLRHVCSVSGLTDELRYDLVAHPEQFRGRVFEATGKGQFDSGALRHPQFSRWRDDKAASECTHASPEGEQMLLLAS